jgi:hypothetical protein
MANLALIRRAALALGGVALVLGSVVVASVNQAASDQSGVVETGDLVAPDTSLASADQAGRPMGEGSSEGGTAAVSDGSCVWPPVYPAESGATPLTDQELRDDVADHIAGLAGVVEGSAPDPAQDRGFTSLSVGLRGAPFTVWWKGEAPADVVSYIESKPLGVEVVLFEGCRYSRADLGRAMSAVFASPFVRDLNAQASAVEGSGRRDGVLELEFAAGTLAQAADRWPQWIELAGPESGRLTAAGVAEIARLAGYPVEDVEIAYPAGAAISIPAIASVP